MNVSIFEHTLPHCLLEVFSEIHFKTLNIQMNGNKFLYSINFKYQFINLIYDSFDSSGHLLQRFESSNGMNLACSVLYVNNKYLFCMDISSHEFDNTIAKVCRSARTNLSLLKGCSFRSRLAEMEATG